MSAKQDAEGVQELLASNGITAELADDSAPGVLQGVWEVRVASADELRAAQIIAEAKAAEESKGGDPSARLDLVTVFRASGQTAGLEALEIKSLLDAGGITAVLVGDTRLPNLPQDVRVPRAQREDAQRVIADALAAGPAAADEAEAGTEPGPAA